MQYETMNEKTFDTLCSFVFSLVEHFFVVSHNMNANDREVLYLVVVFSSSSFFVSLIVHCCCKCSVEITIFVEKLSKRTTIKITEEEEEEKK